MYHFRGLRFLSCDTLRVACHYLVWFRPWAWRCRGQCNSVQGYFIVHLIFVPCDSIRQDGYDIQWLTVFGGNFVKGPFVRRADSVTCAGVLSIKKCCTRMNCCVHLNVLARLSLCLAWEVLNLVSVCLWRTSSWRRSQFWNETGSNGYVILSGLAKPRFRVFGPGG